VHHCRRLESEIDNGYEAEGFVLVLQAFDFEMNVRSELLTTIVQSHTWRRRKTLLGTDAKVVANLTPDVDRAWHVGIGVATGLAAPTWVILPRNFRRMRYRPPVSTHNGDTGEYLEFDSASRKATRCLRCWGYGRL